MIMAWECRYLPAEMPVNEGDTITLRVTQYLPAGEPVQTGIQQLLNIKIFCFQITIISAACSSKL